MSFRNALVVIGVALVLVVVWHTTAFAEIQTTGVLDRVLDKFHAAAHGWASVVQGAASRLFWTLVPISMVWTFGMMAMRRADAMDVLAEAARFTIFTGFYWWLLSNAPAMSESILTSMRQLGAQASGLKDTLSPSSIVDVGFSIAATVFEQSSVWSPVTSGVGMVVALVILVVLALVAVNMLLLLVTSWFLAYAGIFFLGFGGARWTSEIAIGYYKAVLAIGAQLMGMVLLVGIGQTFVDEFAQSMSADVKLIELAVIMVVAICLLVVTNKVPGVLGALATGGGHVGHALGSGAGVGTAMTAAGLATAGVATGAAMLGSAAANVGGAVQAMRAAHGAARAEMGFGSGGGGSNGTGGRSGGALASAMGDSSASRGAKNSTSVGGDSSSSGSSASGSAAAKQSGGRKQNETSPSSAGSPNASEENRKSGEQKSSTGGPTGAASGGSGESPEFGGRAIDAVPQSPDSASVAAQSNSVGEEPAAPSSSDTGTVAAEALNTATATDDAPPVAGMTPSNAEVAAVSGEECSLSASDASRTSGSTSLEFDSAPAAEQNSSAGSSDASTVPADTTSTGTNADGVASTSRTAQSDAAVGGGNLNSATEAASQAGTDAASGESPAQASARGGGRHLETAARATRILGRATVAHVKNAAVEHVRQRVGATVGGRIASAIREQQREPPDASEVTAFREGVGPEAEENSISRGKTDV